jgi:L-gulono-1,4-lactone dehydrogenase
MPTTAATRWRNWAGNQECTPAVVASPETEDELAATVRQAASDGHRVKAIGAGHSFTGCALTDGVQVRLDRYQGVLHVDRESRLVTVQAGITLRRLNAALAAQGLAMENLGDIAYQSVAGAIATSTHGTGARFGGLATQVVGMRVVTGDGEVLELSAGQEPELFAAARVGVGALGMVSTVTLQCVPAFRLHAVEEPQRVDAVLEALDDHVDGNDHFEFFWVPHTGWALTKTNRRTDEPADPPSRWRSFRDGVLVENVAFGAACRVGRWRPSLIPRAMKLVPSSGRKEYVERSDKVFASPRLVHFYEMEYAVPREHAVAAVNGVREYVRRSGLQISFPVEVRFTRGDDIPLSTASGRDSCYVAVHVYRGMQYHQYFTAVESIMDELGGRPHWGKLHFQTAATLASRYPRWAEAQTARARLDPPGTFRNEYTDRVLGA